MADQLEEIKSKIDIVELINSYVPLKKTGRNFKALCPFHSETLPSFIVSPERQIWHCFGACLPSGELVKTDRGYQKIETVKKGQKVLTHKGRFKTISKRWVRFYSGELVDIRVRKSSEEVSLTTNHKVYVIKSKNCKQQGRKTRICQKHCSQRCPTKYYQDYKLEKIEAGKLRKNDYLLLPIDQEVTEVNYLKLNEYLDREISFYARRLKDLPSRVKVDKKFLQLMGYWIAEGHADKYGHVRFALGTHEGEFARDIVKLAGEVFGLKGTIIERDQEKNGSTGLVVTLNSSNLANIINNLCGKGAKNKQIPVKLKNLPLSKQRIILEAIFRGDGTSGRVAKTQGRRTYRSITTVSPLLADQLRDILLRLKIIPTVTVIKPKVDRNNVSHQKAYILSWQEDFKLHFADFYSDNDLYGALFPIKEITKRKYRGKVYNLTTSIDHSYVTKNFVVKNCGEGGDIFRFLMKIENLDFAEALRELAKRAGIKLQAYRPSQSEQQRQLLYEINHLASEFYHYLLLEHPAGKRALDYILGRGITRESLVTFRLGYSPKMWDGLQQYLLGKKKYRAEDLERTGLIIPRSQSRTSGRNFYDRFRDRLMFPLKDHRGNIRGFAGRILDPVAKEAKYVNTPETLIYHKSDLLYGLFENKQAIKEEDQAILVEGELDTISSVQAGVAQVVAIKGSALTASQVQLLSRFTKNLTLALDADLAGNQAAQKGIEVSEAAGMKVKVIKVKGGKDPDEVAQKKPDLWKKLVVLAAPVYDYLINESFERHNAASGEGKGRISEEVIPVLAKIQDRIVQAHYLQILAQRLGVDEEAVAAQLNQYQFKSEAQVQKSLTRSLPTSRQEILEEYLLALAFQSKNWNWLKKRRVKALVKTPRFVRILEVLADYTQRYKTFISERLAKMLPEELLDAFNQLYLLQLSDLLEEDRAEIEFAETLYQLEKLDTKAKLRQTANQIRLSEKAKKPNPEQKKQLKELNEAFRDLTNRLTELEQKELK